MIEKHYKDATLKIFALNSNHPLAEKIAEEVGVELGDIKISRFADGEIKVNIEESVRGDHIYLIQSTSHPVNDNIMELLITIDALRRASVDHINVVIPYYGYARQDRKAQPREPITAKLVADMLQLAGADRVVALDLHASQIQGFFNIPVDHLLGSPLLANYFLDSGLHGDDVVVVSPDHGGVKRARKLAEFLSSPIAIIDKRRPKDNVAVAENIVGDVKGKKCILIDDMIDTGGTITEAVNMLARHGAKETYITATHALFSGECVNRLNNSSVNKVVVTDSIQLEQEKIDALGDKLQIVSVSQLVAEAIKRIHENKSVSPLFNETFDVE